MSQPQLFTIDFLGLGSDNNGSHQVDSAMDCHQQLLHRRSTQSCLGKIRPHMLQQVLSHGCLSDPENFHREAHIGVSEGIKTLDLFPQHSLGFQSIGKQDDSQPALLDTQIKISEAATTNPSFSLPIARKLSLQRFLQKRSDRLSRLIPYSTSSK